jgi:hypothetical protein
MFTPDSDGTYDFYLDAMFDSVLTVISDCSDVVNSCLGSADDAGSGESLSLQLQSGNTVYVIVEGYTGTHSGEYTLQIASQ